jgi:hypothetical protein
MHLALRDKKHNRFLMPIEMGGAFGICVGEKKIIQINYEPDANNFPVYYPDVCLQPNLFRAFSRPSSGTQ